MAIVASLQIGSETLADLLVRLGDVPPSRVRLRPPPGMAAEEDVIRARESAERRLCELVDGVLVEKPIGFRESLLAAALIRALGNFVEPRQLGLVAGPDGFMRLSAGLVRIPGISFVAWKHVPGGVVPSEPIPDLAPDLAVEVLSPSNTRAEMARKRQEYFTAGARLVWIVDPDARTVEVFTPTKTAALLRSTDTLDGGDVIPGFALHLSELFGKLDSQAPAVQE
jgi:Uma2 family endonuclease